MGGSNASSKKSVFNVLGNLFSYQAFEGERLIWPR